MSGNYDNYQLFGKSFPPKELHDRLESVVFPPNYARRSDELWSNQYLEELRSKKRKQQYKLDLLDVGTGSGVAAVHWLRMMPDEISSVTLTDKSSEAISFAKECIETFFKGTDNSEGVVEVEKRIGPSDNSFFHLAYIRPNSFPVNIFLAQTADGCVWPGNEYNLNTMVFDYIVFNGPHLDIDEESLKSKEININKQGLIDGISDKKLSANIDFVTHLSSKLRDRDSRALLTFSDISKEDKDVEEPIKSSLIRLSKLARENSLSATFLSIIEFNLSMEKLYNLFKVHGIHKTRITLWYNVILRKRGSEDKFNLHKTISGYLSAATEIADIYCRKWPSVELYEELKSRMLTIYSMMCEQVGPHKGIENEFTISGFSLPALDEAKPPEYNFASWIFGEGLIKSEFKTSREEFMHKYLDTREKIRNCQDSKSPYYECSLATDALINTDIYRLEIRQSKKNVQKYADKNSSFVYNQYQRIGNNSTMTTDMGEHQVRWRIQLGNDNNVELLAEGNGKKNKYVDEGDYNGSNYKYLTELNKVLNTVRLNFGLEFSTAKNVAQDDGNIDPKGFKFCLFSRYSGVSNKSAIFYLLSSTEDLPFLQSLRAFGRIANTAANNMLSGLAVRKALTRSARAAVFARNFSHITGSHVISNPEFRNSLAGYHFVHGLRRRLDETYSNFLRAENGLMKYITQDLYRAEDLWAQGTKALADARDKLGTGDVFQENTRRFHEYLQGRFDFIARAIDDTQDPPEPVWFVRDLLEGFLRQTAYLDNLVADVGLRLDNMEFYVKIKDQEFRAQWIQPQTAGKNGTNRLTADLPFEIEWENVTSVNSNGVRTSQQQIYELDKMVAVPGGMVAAHAFYSLLENIMRNSAKYGDLRRQVQDGIYRLVIDLNTPSDSDLEAQAGLINGTSVMPSFCIKVSDNFSSDVDASGLQEKLKKPFVRPSGQPETDDLGMMEMQACSQLLCRPDGDGLYTRLNGDNPSKLEKTQFNLRVSPPDEGHAYLTYELNIEMPILLGCLTVKEIKSIPSCLYTNRPERLRSQTPFLMVIDGDWLNEKDNPQRDEIDKLLFESRESLPNRILILYSKANIARLEGLELVKTRRIIIVDDDPTLYSKVFGPTTHEVTSLNKDECILDVYRAWLLKRKPLPDGSPWDLWIGLDRQASQVREAWGHADKLMDDESKRLVRLMVKSSDSQFSTESVKQCYGGESVDSKSVSKYWGGERKWHLSQKKVLLFDNHGNCFPEAYQFEKADSLETSTRFYQKLSGSVSPDLFRMLSRPPQDKFSFCFFIYSLIEACLTNVVVVDERLAWSLVEGYGIDESNRNFAQDLLEHQKAGIFPVFRFRQGETPNAENAKADEDQSIGFYNSVHKDRLDECLGASKFTLQNEGISFAATANGSSSLGLITPSGSNPGEAGGFEILSDIKDADVILIHEGAMDILTDQMGVKWVGVDNVDNGEHSRQLKALYQLAPIIIRTSGRGRKSKLLGEHLPFIEFGQVSSSLLTARNKFALVRGLLGSVGSERTDG